MPGGGSRLETHDGAIHQCEDSRCAAVMAGMADQDEKLNAVQADLAKEGAEIAEWWVKTAMRDAEKTVPKAVEYGAVDFDIMGQAMVALVADKFNGADDAELMRVGREMACMFYLLGKVGRMIGAYQAGVMPSDDTLFDTSVYAMMLRRIREKGNWING